jgi:Cu/Ag efflux protein CusF
MRKYALRAVTAASLVIVALAFALPLRAADEKTEKAEKPKKHQFTGTVDSMTADTVTVKNAKGETKSFKVSDKTRYATMEKKEAMMSDIKTGEKVTVMYTEMDGVAAATKISPPESMKKKEMMKSE